MFSFRANPPLATAESTTPMSTKTPAHHKFDDATGGAFSAPTSGERAQKLRAWLATDPGGELMNEVFKEMSHRDKGAARVLKDRLDELKRSKGQESLIGEWADKVQALLAGSKLNVADALAWQRDAAKAGAPLSKPPLADFRAQLAERVKAVEDLQHRLMVQREAAMMLAQRCDVLSTKPLSDALGVQESLSADVANWRVQTDALHQEAAWASVDAKYVAQIQSANQQLVAVWDAFSQALGVAAEALSNVSAPLPQVPVWADELRAKRGIGQAHDAGKAVAKPAPKAEPIDPAEREAANAAVTSAATALEKDIAEGHTKSLSKTVADLRAALKAHGRRIDAELDQKAHALLTQAGELGGWQRWRADQIRQELVAKAEALAAPHRPVGAKLVSKKPVKVTIKPASPQIGMATDSETGVAFADAMASTQPDVPNIEPTAIEATPSVVDAPPTQVSSEVADALDLEPSGEQAVVSDITPPADSEPVPSTDLGAGPHVGATADGEPVAEPLATVPGLSGRKMQAALRELRDQWKQTDSGGAPNHGLWRRFDEACGIAHKVVEQWLTTVKAEEEGNKAKRFALIDELNAWAVAQSGSIEFKMHARELHHFAQRWRDAGHVGEKAFDLLQPKWKAAIKAAHAPLEGAQSASMARRKGLIDEAQQLAETVAVRGLRIDAVRSLQQRWQHEAQSLAMDRKLEQKMWEQFRTHIDAAFAAKSAQREQANAQLSEFDQRVLDASKALEAANTSQDAAAIRMAMDALQVALRSPAQRPVTVTSMVSTVEANNREVASDSIEFDATKIAANEAMQAHEPGVPATPDAAPDDAPQAAVEEPVVAAVIPVKPSKPVVARRGDDRPGAAKAGLAPRADARDGSRGNARGRPPARSGGPSGAGGPAGGARLGAPAARGGDRRDDRGGSRMGAGDMREPREAMGPRLGDAAFRAQREAFESAQAQLRKLAALAHGEAVTQLLTAWERRESQTLPTLSNLGRAINAATRTQWEQAIAQPPSGADATVLLRLEMAAEVPTPAAHLDARRALQLQLLTKRHEPPPSQTWGVDVAKALRLPHDDESAKRLRTALKSLLR